MDYICKQPDFGIYVSKKMKIKNKQRKKLWEERKLKGLKGLFWKKGVAVILSVARF